MELTPANGPTKTVSFGLRDIAMQIKRIHVGRNLEIRNQKLETRNQKLETRNQIPAR